MSAEAMARPAERPMALPLDAVAVVMFALLSAVYVGQATALAARAPFWMDEVLAVWTARLPDARAIWSALVRGAEFNPPLYDFFLHLLMRAGVTGPLGLRLPSIVAIYVAALGVGAIVRRRGGIAPAALAAGVVLSSGLFGYAVQARPYALVTAAATLAVMVWERGNMSTRRLVMLSALLAVAIGLNFYALLLAGALAVLEIARAREERRAPCRRTLLAIGLASASILAWWPILIAARTYSAADVDALAYYARPTPSALMHGCADLVGWLVFPLIGLGIAAILWGERPARASALLAPALVLSAVPAGVFVFALLVSGSYAARYALMGVPGVALGAAVLVVRLGHRAEAASVLLLGLLLLGTAWRDRGEIAKPDRLDALAAVDAAPARLPIATGSGLRFLELWEARPALRRRLVFLHVPEGVPGLASVDPTNRHQVLRWHAIRPELLVADARAFLCATPAFLLFAQPGGGGADDLPGWLARRGHGSPPPDHASLTLVRTRSCK